MISNVVQIKEHWLLHYINKANGNVVKNGRHDELTSTQRLPKHIKDSNLPLM